MEGHMVVKEPEQLPPVRPRAVWIAWGLALQAIGVGLPVAAALRRASKDGVLGSATRYSVRLVWHRMLQSRADIALIVVGVIVFAAGSVVLARPLVRRSSTLYVAVPSFAVAGVVVLGVIALVIAAVIAAVEGSGRRRGAILSSHRRHRHPSRPIASCPGLVRRAGPFPA